jgi:hypothetical protein
MLILLGSVVVEAVYYKLEGRWLSPDEASYFFFTIYLILPAALSAGVWSTSNRNEYQKQTKKVSGE